MKPIRLIMTAFGPYRDSETIDFRELKENRLFVVSGSTGAGKTTIFDAISFALYGSASGEDRSETKMLRSDFADDETHTCVELEFELRERKYRILRQLSHVKQGNKSATGEKYEFYEICSDGEKPCVDRQIVSEINKKVEELIGLTQDQFSQIVMLPQGEFRKLLTSQTENKEEILRKIFKTDSYKKMSERLKEKKAVTNEIYNQEVIKRDSYLKSISSVLPMREDSTLISVLAQEQYNVNQVLAALEEEVSYYENQMEKDQSNYDLAYQKHDLKLAEFHIANSLNERFNVLIEKNKKLEQLNNQVAEIELKEKQFEQGERASHLQAYENQLNSLIQEVLHKTNTYEESLTHEKVAKQRLEQIQIQFEVEKNKKTERENTAALLTRLKSYLPEVKDLKKRKDLHLELTKRMNYYSDLINDYSNKIDSTRQEKEDLAKQIKEKERTVDQLPEIQEKHAQLREQYKTINEVIRIQKQVETLEVDLKNAENAYHNWSEQYKQIENAWVNSQASVLAAHLHDGNACPVCGSLEHPKKANENEIIVTKEQLDASKQESNTYETKFRTIQAEYRTSFEQLNIKLKEVTSLTTASINDEAEYLVAEGKKLRMTLDHLQQIRSTLQPLRDKFDTIEKELDLTTQKKVNVEKEYLETKTAYDTNKAILENKQQIIPEEMQILTKLETRILETEQYRAALENAWEQVQNEYQQATASLSTASLNVEHARKQLNEVISKKLEASHQFDQALHAASFESKDDYVKSKQPKEKLEQLKNEFTTFKQLHHSLTQQVNELELELKDKKSVDLTEMEQTLKELKHAYETALHAYNLSKDYKSEGEQLLRNIRTSNEQVATHEKQLSIITDLYDMVRGQNQKKISFERYIQIEYLEQIIQAANERLKTLSNGQFYLIRSDRQESRGKQSGLGLDVYDAYTGMTRDVKTLSGGEKFNASLCLALGMADVIQSFQGGVSIETMFIDEGFGSLDEESLYKSIDTLIELQQSGRMIGVISHVQELKAAIPAILEVSKTKEGYSQTQFILK
ncbi:AAA family ATPase [Bacillus sp. PS06]|uniref:AAA family ATPase n=1 Tax=Bacillus sp. PS06 TaxID=2764176 RepID=UPI00177BCF71|nr:SMC family ATPase [Bacillus sp. PS06]MBD8067986.1 SMC family ATPase [Bacillus sp. PS06]